MVQEIASPSSRVAVPPKPATDGHSGSPVMDTNSYPGSSVSLIAIAVLAITGREDPEDTTVPPIEGKKLLGVAAPVRTTLVSVIFGAISSLVIVQDLTCPAVNTTLPFTSQSPLEVAVYPPTPVSLTAYAPAATT